MNSTLKSMLIAAAALTSVSAFAQDKATLDLLVKKGLVTAEERAKLALQRKAEELGIPVRHPASLKGEEEQAEFAALGAGDDIGVRREVVEAVAVDVEVHGAFLSEAVDGL